MIKNNLYYAKGGTDIRTGTENERNPAWLFLMDVISGWLLTP